MTQNLGKAVLTGLAFIVSSILILGLIITMFAYFEWFSIGVIEKLVYMTFVLSLFLGTSVAAKIVSEKGWLIGLLMGALFTILTVLFYTVGVEAGLTFKVFIRCLIILVICLTGGMVGVNLPSLKR